MGQSTQLKSVAKIAINFDITHNVRTLKNPAIIIVEVNKKIIAKKGSLIFVNPKFEKMKYVGLFSHISLGESRKLINGIILAIDNVSAIPLDIISNEQKKNCFFLLTFRAFQIPLNK